MPDSSLTVTIEPAAVNAAPVVIGDIQVITSEDNGEVWVNPTANAYDPDLGQILRVTDLPADLPVGVSWNATWNVLMVDTSNAAFQSLGAGQQVTISITYGVTDGQLTTPNTANITIMGVNDLAVVGGASAGQVTEDAALAVSGLLTISDVDTGQSAFQATVTPIAGAYGSLTLTAAGGWTYNLNNDLAAVQGLATGATLTDTITVLTVDGTEAVITITINGANEPVPTITGTSGADRLTGTTGADFVSGLGGKDMLNGKGGADTLDGGSGADSLYGDTGDDVVIYDALDKIISGGADSDTLKVLGAATVNLAAQDQTSGDAGTTSGFENVNASGASAAVVLTGSKAANSLIGGTGADRLTGGRGADALTGGAGADRFVFGSLDDSRPGAASHDTIMDFQPGVDSVDLSAIDAITGGANNAFTWIGVADFSATGSAGQLRYDQATGLLQADVNGDRIADFEVFFGGNPALGASDFIL